MTDADHAAVLRQLLEVGDPSESTYEAIERAIELLQLNHAKKEHQAEVLRRMGEQAEEQGLEY